jgi:hypothetical protein
VRDGESEERGKREANRHGAEDYPLPGGSAIHLKVTT